MEKAIAAIFAGARNLSSLKYAGGLALITSGLLAITAFRDSSPREIAVALMVTFAFMFLLLIFHTATRINSSNLVIVPAVIIIYAISIIFIVSISLLASHAFGGVPKCLPILVTSCERPAANLDIAPIEIIDFRTEVDQSASIDDRLEAKVAVTAPIAIANTGNPDAPIYLEKTEAHVRLDGQIIVFDSIYFTNMHPEQYGYWLAIIESFSRKILPFGEAMNFEILHLSASGITWREFVDKLENSRADLFRIDVKLFTSEGTEEMSCEIDLPYWRGKLIEFQKTVGHDPFRITWPCLQSGSADA